MVIPEGYKQTEIGVIPEDWEVQPFSNLFSIGHGKDQKEIEEKDGKFPILATSGVIGYTNKFLYNKPSALIGRKGTINKPQYTETPFWTIDTLFYTKVFDNTFPKYIYYIFCVIDWLSLNEASGVPSLSAYNIEKIRCAIPSLSEQRIIANALSNVDGMISSLEKLIEKKKAIKQGAMKELLTGKKRLPGFASEWDYMELGKFGMLLKKSINPQTFPTNYFWEYSMPAFDTDKQPNKQLGMDMHSNRISIKGTVLLFNKLNVRQKRIWLIENCRENALCSSEFLPYQSNQINLDLLAHILRTDKVTLDFIGMSTGTSNSQKRITPNSFLEYKVFLPTDREEQAAIASFLSDMDNEIDALEQKLEKAHQLKQGMMQQLLTGKIRLI